MRWVWLLAACLMIAGCATQGPDPGADGADGAEGDLSPDDPGGETDGTDDTGDSSDPDGTDDSGSGEDSEANTTDQTGGSGAEEPPMTLTSPAFDDGTAVPEPFTCDGDDRSPELVVSQVPANASSLALIVDDPDAPTPEPWVHWLIWDLPADQELRIPEGYPPSGDATAFEQAVQGNTSYTQGDQRYRGPCPPEGDGPHRYRFQAYALDVTLELGPETNRTQLDAAMEGHLLDTATLTGIYER